MDEFKSKFYCIEFTNEGTASLWESEEEWKINRKGKIITDHKKWDKIYDLMPNKVILEKLNYISEISPDEIQIFDKKSGIPLICKRGSKFYKIFNYPVQYDYLFAFVITALFIIPVIGICLYLNLSLIITSVIYLITFSIVIGTIMTRFNKFLVSFADYVYQLENKE